MTSSKGKKGNGTLHIDVSESEYSRIVDVLGDNANILPNGKIKVDLTSSDNRLAEVRSVFGDEVDATIEVDGTHFIEFSKNFSARQKSSLVVSESGQKSFNRLGRMTPQQLANLLIEANKGKDAYDISVALNAEDDFSNLHPWQMELLVEMLIRVLKLQVARISDSELVTCSDHVSELRKLIEKL